MLLNGRGLLIAFGLCLVLISVLLWGTSFGDVRKNPAPENVVILGVASPPEENFGRPPEVDFTSSLPSSARNPSSAPTTASTEAPKTAGEKLSYDGIEEPGRIQVAAQPTEVLAWPASSAPMLYGYPAGRPLRVIGHFENFVRIEDVKSGAWGWVEKSALVTPLRVVSKNPESKLTNRERGTTASGTPKLSPSSKRQRVAAKSTFTKPALLAPAPTREFRGIFGSRKRVDKRKNIFDSFVMRGFGAH